MSQGITQYPCAICGHGGHSVSRCKEIGIPPDGFYKPAPGQHQHDDDEDESIYIDGLKYAYNMWLNRAIKNMQTPKMLSLP